MNAARPAGAIVQRRGREPRRWIAASDLAIALSLVLAAACAVLPQRAWLGAALALARLRRALGLERPPVSASARAPRDGARAWAYQFELRIQNCGALLGRWRPAIAVAGTEHVDAAIATHGAAVLWVAHTACNSNVVKRALHDHGYALHHVSRPEHGFSKTRFGIRVLNALRRRAEDRDLRSRIVIGGAGNAMRTALLRLREPGALVSITAGAWEGTKLLRVRFLDADLLLASGAPGLARAARVPLLPVFAARTGRDQAFTLRIGAPIAVERAGTKDAALLAAAHDYARLTEAFVAEYPEQWRGWKALLPLAS